MKRTAIGAVAGLAIWFGSALAAEAQVIQPTGPMAIYSGNTTATYTADVTIPYLQPYSVDIWVYRGLNPIAICSGTVYNYNPTDLTTSISFCANWSPAAASGQVFKFKATLNFMGTAYPAPDKIITISRLTYVQPTKPLDLAMEFVERDRRHEA
jgi:hypothetical protein